MNPYAELGIPRDASADAVKRAYQKRAHETHPDKGGATADFQRVGAAYRLLADPERRKRFDETGDAGEQVGGVEQQRMQALASLILQIIDQQHDPARVNVVKLAQGNLREAIAAARQAIKAVEAQIAKRERVRVRVHRQAGDNLVAKMIQADIEQRQRTIEVAKKNIAEAEMMIAMLSEYTFDVERGEMAHHQVHGFMVSQ